MTDCIVYPRVCLGFAPNYPPGVLATNVWTAPHRRKASLSDFCPSDVWLRVAHNRQREPLMLMAFMDNFEGVQG